MLPLTIYSSGTKTVLIVLHFSCGSSPCLCLCPWRI